MTLPIFLICAQQPKGLRCKYIIPNTIYTLDTLTVYGPSIRVDSTVKFEFDQTHNTMLLKTDRTDSIKVCYYTLPFNISKRFYRLDIKEYEQTQYYSTKSKAIYSFAKPPLLEREELFSFQSFNKSGNFTRGISAGNNQNAFVNSSLNLQLDGNITEKMKLTAAISDQNMPIQPNGYTQNIQQFDRVYLQLEQERVFRITAGDYVLKNRNEGYFLKYLKNVQGLQGHYFYKLGSTDTANTMVGLSFAKGKFSSLQILGSAIAEPGADQVLEEGALGPYRLTGPNKERFVQVIANSEKIYLDGRELTRGFNNDYVIDYNSGEVRFTPNILITKYSRVRVDFEYTDRNYARSNYQLSHQQQWGKWGLQLDYYSEKDNARSPLAISLSDNDKLRLSEVGDTLEKAYVQGGDSVGYAAGALLYSLVKDTLANGSQYQNIYKYSVDPLKAFYLVSFSYVGQGNGDYAPSSTINNGRVYEWIAPINGNKQGSFSPQRIVPTPKLKIMLTAGLKYQLSTNEKVYVEAAVSKNDLNLYSKINDADNQGKALKVGYENKGRKLFKKRKIQYLGGLDLEVLDKNFVPMDRFRPVDFDRDWNASPTTQTNNLFDNKVVKAEDRILTLSAGLKDSLTLVKYTHVLREKEGDVQGKQQKLEWQKRYKKAHWKGAYFTMDNDLVQTAARWQKMYSDLSINFRSLKQGYIYDAEANKQYIKQSDSVIRSYQNYELHRFYTHSGDSLKKVRFKFYNEHRQDYIPYLGKITKSSLSKTQSLALNSKIKQMHDLGLSTTLRNTENALYASLGGQPQETTLISRLDWSGLMFKKSIKSELTYSTATGRELRREYIYIPVPTGQGNFTWRDDNQDGIQQLNEFYEALNFDEKNYIKAFVPTNQYVASYSSNYIYRLNLSPPAHWKRKKKFLFKQLQQLSASMYYTLDKSTLRNDIWQRVNPIYGNLSDPYLLHANSNFRSSLFWNRQNSKYGLEHNFSHQTQKQLLSNGFEARNNILHQFIGRKNIGSKFITRSFIDLQDKSSLSDYLSNRNYKVKGYKIRQELVFQPHNSLRLTASVAYGQKKNAQDTLGEFSQNQEILMECRYSKVSSRTLQVSFRYNKLLYKFNTNTPLAYEMLDALQPGDNYYWNVSYTQKILNGLQLTLNYDGRRSGTQAITHIGRIQATALF